MSLSKAKAKLKAINNTETWRQLLEMVIDCRGIRHHSVLNKSMSLDASLNIMESAIREYKLDLSPVVIRCDKGTLSVSGVIVMNIYRECGN